MTFHAPGLHPGLSLAPHLRLSYHLGSRPSLGHHDPTEFPFSSMAVIVLPSLSPRTSACSLLCHKLPVSTHPMGLPTPRIFGETAPPPQGLAHCFGFSEQKWIERVISVLFAKLSQFYQELRMSLLCISESSSEMTYSSRYSSLSLLGGSAHHFLPQGSYIPNPQCAVESDGVSHCLLPPARPGWQLCGSGVSLLPVS